MALRVDLRLLKLDGFGGLDAEFGQQPVGTYDPAAAGSLDPDRIGVLSIHTDRAESEPEIHHVVLYQYRLGGVGSVTVRKGRENVGSSQERMLWRPLCDSWTFIN